MDDLQTLLDQLEDRRLDYVLARSRVTSDKQAYEGVGLHKSVFYSWSTEEREKLNDLAQRVKRATAIIAIRTLQEAAEEAAKVKVGGLRSKNEHIKQDAASEILDRTVGKSTQPIDVTSGGDKIIVTLKGQDD